MDSFALTIKRTDAGYPRRLSEVKDGPEWLQFRGRLLEAEQAIVIVGARAADEDQVRLAYELAYALARRGTLVISGGALGVDAAAHRGALAAAREPGTPASGTTVAVLGCGLDVVYPERHVALFHEIATAGALVSQFPRDTAPRAWYFARRNRTMAALADAVLVIGAGAHSGALRTAQAARSYGRLLAAVPGSPGCEALIASGAAVVREIADLDRAFAGTPSRPTVSLPDKNTPNFQVLSLLQPGSAHGANELAVRLGFNIRVVQRALTSLELDGLVVPRAGLGYECSLLAQELLAARGASG